MAAEIDEIVDDIKAWIDVAAMSGLRTLDAIADGVTDQVDDELDGDEEQLGALIAYAESAVAAHASSAEIWPRPTMNDRIDDAFDALIASGIVALQGVGYTMSEGWEDVNAVASHLAQGGKRPRGAVFYHWQDLERGVRDEGLMLAFGSYVDGEGKDAAALAVAAEVVAMLTRAGVPTTWTGSLDDRIAVQPFKWQRRFSG